MPLYLVSPHIWFSWERYVRKFFNAVETVEKSVTRCWMFGREQVTTFVIKDVESNASKSSRCVA